MQRWFSNEWFDGLSAGDGDVMTSFFLIALGKKFMYPVFYLFSMGSGLF
jgi:hypothetical protein